MNNILYSVPHRVLLVPRTPQTVAHLPQHTKVLQINGETRFVIPHDLDATKLLRNLGYDTPSPLLYYDWKGGTPWDIQRITADMLVTSPRAFVLSEMGTGKTRAILYAADWLMQKGIIERALIIAPLSTLGPVWWNEIFRYLPGRTAIQIHHRRKQKRLQLLGEKADFYILNHDGISVIEEQLHEKQFDLIIVDELASFRNKSTDRHKKLRKLTASTPFVWGATGSPTPNEPSDAWGQCRIINPSRVPKYFKQFKEATMYQVSQYKWLPRPDAQKIVHAAMRPAVRFKREDCADIPEVAHVYRDFPLSPKQQKVYDAIFKYLAMEYEGGRITAANAGVKLSKLLQIACGYVYTDSHGVVELDGGARLAEVGDIIEQNNHKTIVFVPYIHAVEGIAKHLTKSSKVTKKFEVITGQTPKAVRDKVFIDFQGEGPPYGIVAHPGTMSHGLTLTQANTIIWFGPITSLETYEQANARITRPGQKNKSLIIHFRGAPVEKLVYAKLKSKQFTQESLLELFAGVVE